MDNVRPITLVGLCLGILALMAITYSLPAAIVLGICGMAVSGYALLTSKDRR
jgi:FtsH-binding integral membrane protein